MLTESHPDGAPEPVLLVIADIGGYTRYMTANAKTLAHSQTIITELIWAIMRGIELPLEVAKLEGDAVFLFCRRPQDTLRWSEIRAEISVQLLNFFRSFREKLEELSRYNLCACDGCAHLEKLRLKIIVHSGEALFHRVLHFNELAGVDVIIVHRLLKNSVKSEQYLLLTEAAMRELQFPETIAFKSSVESYEDIGSVATRYHDVDLAMADAHPGREKSFGARYRESLGLFVKLWFRPLRSTRGNFRNLADGSSRLAKLGLALLTVLLTPFVVPAGALLVIFHSPKAAR